MRSNAGRCLFTASSISVVICAAVLYLIYKRSEEFMKPAVLFHASLQLLVAIGTVVLTCAFALFVSSLSQGTETDFLNFNFQFPWYMMLFAAVVSTINACRYTYVIYDNYRASLARSSGQIYDLEECSSHSDAELVRVPKASRIRYQYQCDDNSSIIDSGYQRLHSGRRSLSRILGLFGRDDNHSNTSTLDMSDSSAYVDSSHRSSPHESLRQGQAKLGAWISKNRSKLVSLHDIDSSWR
jgi:hypothetical protein